MIGQVHRTREGQWAVCETRYCRLIHIPNTTVEDMQSVPEPILWELIETFDPPSEILSSGTKNWYDKAGRFHRNFDLPAQLLASGTASWHQHDLQTRSNGKPAVVHARGALEWWVDSKRHRLDGPAVIDPDQTHGYEEWYVNGIRHRADGPAYTHGDEQKWFVNGKLHRIDGPAIVTSSNRSWYLHGKLVPERMVMMVSEFRDQIPSLREMGWLQ